jgi:hypothetical protein
MRRGVQLGQKLRRDQQRVQARRSVASNPEIRIGIAQAPMQDDERARAPRVPHLPVRPVGEQRQFGGHVLTPLRSDDLKPLRCEGVIFQPQPCGTDRGHWPPRG